MKNFKLITQEDPMGCGVACVASLIGISYEEAQKFFKENHSVTRGYYLKEILEALSRKNLNYKFRKITDKTKKFISKKGSIVFIKRSKKYLSGHYLLKTSKGWMNPWANYPKINPAQAGFNKRLPGEAQWIIYEG